VEPRRRAPPPTSATHWGTKGVEEEAADWGRTGGGGIRGGEEAADWGTGAEAADSGTGGGGRLGEWELGFHPAYIHSQRKQQR
jgi:hypothetical protein